MITKGEAGLQGHCYVQTIAWGNCNIAAPCCPLRPRPTPTGHFDSMRIGGSASDLPRETAILRPARPQMPLPGNDYLSKSAGSSPFMSIRRMDPHALMPQISITAEDEFIEQGGCVRGGGPRQGTLCWVGCISSSLRVNQTVVTS